MAKRLTHEYTNKKNTYFTKSSPGSQHSQHMHSFLWRKGWKVEVNKISLLVPRRFTYLTCPLLSYGTTTSLFPPSPYYFVFLPSPHTSRTFFFSQGGVVAGSGVWTGVSGVRLPSAYSEIFMKGIHKLLTLCYYLMANFLRRCLQA